MYGTLDNEINSTRLNFTSISLSSATPVSNFHTFSFYLVHFAFPVTLPLPFKSAVFGMCRPTRQAINFEF